MDLKYIGANIRARRKELGLTIIDVQRATGISNGNLSGIETGKSAPSAHAIISLAKVLKCSTDYLLLNNACSDYSRLNNLSQEETILLERFNSLDPSGQMDLLDYAQYKQFQNFKKSGDPPPNEKEPCPNKETYSHLNPRNSNDIIA